MSSLQDRKRARRSPVSGYKDLFFVAAFSSAGLVLSAVLSLHAMPQTVLLAYLGSMP
jgi:hypothetical protein